MRLALVVPRLDWSSGGLARNVPRLAQALRGTGVSAELCAVGRAAVNAAEDKQTFLGAPAWPARLARSPELKRHLRSTPAHLIHANGLWMAPLGYATSAAAQRRIPLVISPRGMLSPWALQRSRLKKLLARWFVHPGAFQQAAGWHVTSAAEEADVRLLGLRQPVCVAPNGVDPPTDVPAEVRSTYERFAPEIVGKRILLFYSRFHSKKGVAELIHDFAVVGAANWHLLIVGIPEEYSVEDLRARAASGGVSARVTVLDGRSLPQPYAVADLMALPTHEENFGQVVAEALVSGVPAITTTGTPWAALEAVGAGRCVSLDGFREALASLLAWSPEALREAGNRGRGWVLANYSWEATAATLKRFYESLLPAGGRVE